MVQDNTDRGRCHFALNDFDKAMSDFDQSLSLNSENQPLHFNRGLCFMELNQFEAALSSFDLVDSIGDHESDLLLQKGNCYFMLGNYPEAINFYTVVQPMFPDSSSINFLRGSSYFQIGKYKEALADLEYYLSLNTGPSLALEYAALSSFGVGAFQNCISYFERLIENGEVIAGDNFSIYIDALIFSAQESMQMDDYEQALAYLTKANELDPKNKDGFYYRGVLFLELGTREAACEDLNMALTNGQLKAIEPMKYSCPSYFE